MVKIHMAKSISFMRILIQMRTECGKPAPESYNWAKRTLNTSIKTLLNAASREQLLHTTLLLLLILLIEGAYCQILIKICQICL